jgi:hypothetical protein
MSDRFDRDWKFIESALRDSHSRELAIELVRETLFAYRDIMSALRDGIDSRWKKTPMPSELKGPYEEARKVLDELHKGSTNGEGH